MRPLRRLATLALLLAAPALLGQTAPPLSGAQKAAAEKGSHQKEKTIPVARKGALSLQTLTVDDKGRVLGLVSQSRYYTAPAGTKTTSEVHVFTPEGKADGVWKVPFNAQSLNTAPDGTVFVAGDGQVAKFTREGKLLAQIELPHLKKLAADKEGLRKEAQAQIDLQKKSFTASVQRIKDMKASIEKIAAEKRTALQKRQLQQYEQILKSYAATEKYYASLSVDSIVNQTLSRLKIINGVAISKKDIFIACGEAKGYGYAVWRMTHDFKDAKPVLTGCRGCCGQFDIQSLGDDLIVAENTKHRWAKYTRDGKEIGGWGKRGTGAEADCFGGCCNPMNLKANARGDVYTAESEGIIKRYSSKGDFLGVVGHAPLTGGCKNVGVGASPDGKRVFFCDQPGSQIIVMVQKPK